MSPNIFDDEFLNGNESSTKQKEREEIEEMLDKKTAIIHSCPDADVILTLSYLEDKGAKFENFIFEAEGGINNGAKIKNSVAIDTLHGKLDHHGQGKKTSLDMIVEKNDGWMKPILSRILRIDRYGESLFADIGTILKAMVHFGIKDSQIIKKGIPLGRLIIKFHKDGLERDHALTKKIIRSFFSRSNEKMPEVFERYLELLENPRFQRFTDITEIISAKAEIDGKEAAKRLGGELVSLLYQEFGETWRDGKKEAIGKAVKIRIDEKRRDFITIVVTDNPKTHTALLKMGAVAVIQRDSNGNHQLFFNSKLVRKPTTDCITKWVRRVELFLAGKSNFCWEDLISPETLFYCPEWHYFLGEEKGNGERGIFLLNGSLTAPDVPPSKIGIEAIATIVWLCLNKK
ncbi:MAG: hypothetical protein GF370_05010 [Candidatus Nealsonbacteria bacterium]|nr:hypothetical protein [Candidatus Nealsonbacteria bacterium]